MKPALLLVDLQKDYLATPDLQPISDRLVSRAAWLLENCRTRKIPVIHIWTTVRRDDDNRLPHWRRENRWQCVEGTIGHQTPAVLAPHSGETVVHKSGFNAFSDPQLDSALKRGHDVVVIAGLHLHTCVRIAAMECLERGYRVWIADDAVASNDPIHAAATRRWLRARCVEFLPVSAIVRGLEGSPAALVHRSPRLTGQVLFEVPRSGISEIGAAAELSRTAFYDWRRTSPASRCQILDTLANRLDAAAHDLSRQMAIEIGKPTAHGLEEVRRGAANIRDVARRAGAFLPEMRESSGSVRRQPLGVIALISPWNNPVAIPAGKIAPALAYGNTIVWKPAPAATGIAQAILAILHEAGVPAEAVRLIAGDHITAQDLADHPLIDAVTLTGSLAAGYSIQEICARRMIPLQAELGGNNAAIVWDDAGLANAAKQIAWGALGFAGQRCTANRRVIVPKPLFENFLHELMDAADGLVWGDPLDEATDTGPVISAAKCDETAAVVASAQSDRQVDAVHLAQAARAREPWVKTGAYAQPAIVCCDQSDHPLIQEETMSPILVVQRADDFDHALALCDGTRYGLAAALFTNRPDLQKRFLEGARAGILKINSSTAGADIALPFGGWKASGLGPPEHGEADALFYTRMQAVYGSLG